MSENILIPAQRQKHIMELVSRSELLMLPDLVRLVSVSESTLRRDLKELSRRGDIQLLRGGGVRLPQGNRELGLDSRLLRNQTGKMRIARYAARLVYPGDVIYLDPSSTTYMMIDLLRAEDLTVVTNSSLHAQHLLRRGIACVLLGGKLIPSVCATRGPIAEQQLEKLFLSKSFLSVDGVSRPQGLTNRNAQVAALKQVALKRSARSFFLMDASKHNVVTMHHVADIDAHELLTDAGHEMFEGLSNVRVIPA